MLLRRMRCPVSKTPLASAFGTSHLLDVLLCCLQRCGEWPLLSWHRKTCPKVVLILGQLLQARGGGLAVRRGRSGLALHPGRCGVALCRGTGRVLLERLLLRPDQRDAGCADLGLLVGLMLRRWVQLGEVRLLRVLVQGVLVEGLRRWRGTGLPPTLW